MSLSENDRRKHALSRIRRVVAGGKYTKKDVSRWENELGAKVVQEILAAAGGGDSAPQEAKGAKPSPSKE